jgi:cellulose biosynthesis protein BcsQ
MLGAELALRGHRVALVDRDQGKHLSRVVEYHALGMNGLVLGDDPAANVRIVDTAPEVNADRVAAYLRETEWVLVPVKGPESGSVLAIPLLLEWLEAAKNARLLGFLPTMYKPRRAEARQWLDELHQVARRAGTRVFEPIGDLASIASFRLDGHPYALLAEQVEQQVLCAAPV